MLALGLGLEFTIKVRIRVRVWVWVKVRVRFRVRVRVGLLLYFIRKPCEFVENQQPNRPPCGSKCISDDEMIISCLKCCCSVGNDNNV